ncbi:ring finger domain-containing protein [Ditylenchus destructor]|uniref:Ring finger domain-containing protein n=1 Tax=Ditylenchus destructor TaxID=166010 RepID=A0AAD4MM45_9BILA|nr:ring finger domain-containing protein [Ditylenchus destructor]
MANWTCTICLEDLQQEPTCSPSTCGHVLHSKCMKDWVKKQPRCPVCNARVSTRGMRELYFSEDAGDSLKTEKETLESKCQELSEHIKNRDAENIAVRKELASNQERLKKSQAEIGRLIRKKVSLRTELEKQQVIMKVLEKRVESREAQASTQSALAIKIRHRFRQSTRECTELRKQQRLQSHRLSKNAKLFLSGTIAMRKDLLQCKRKIAAFEKIQNAPKIMDEKRERKFRDALQKIQKILSPSAEDNETMETLPMENSHTETTEQLNASKSLIAELRSELQYALKEKEEFSKLNSNLEAELEQKVSELESERAIIDYLQTKLKTSVEASQPSPMDVFNTSAIDQLRDSEALIDELRSKQWEDFKENEQLSRHNVKLQAELQQTVRELERERTTVAQLQTQLGKFRGVKQSISPCRFV